MFYHYTSVDAFVGMLENAKRLGDNNSLIFWASSIYSMNDPSEFKYGMNIIDRYSREYEKDNHIDIRFRLTTAFQEQVDSDPTFGNKQDLLYRYFANSPKTPFILSFSRNKDDLMMWNMYGDKGKGLCLHIEENIPPFSDKDSIISDEVMDVDYSGSIEKNVILCKLYSKVYEDAQCEISNQEENLLLIHRCKNMARLYSRLCPFIKHKKYRIENEVRLSGLLNNLECVKFRTKNGYIIPYVEVAIGLNLLKGITVGPCCDYNFIKRNLDFLLYTRGLNKDIATKEDVKIRQSSIPYRFFD